jgi:hypothetical protein
MSHEEITIDFLIAHFKRPIKLHSNGCWIWQGSISTQGYAIYNNVRVHKLVVEHIHGPLTKEQVTRHLCNNKQCINPKHLKPGTFSENMLDAVKDESRFGIGAAGYRRMAQMAAAGKRQVDIANELNVSRSLVSMFFLGKIMSFKPEDFVENKDV